MNFETPYQSKRCWLFRSLHIFTVEMCLHVAAHKASCLLKTAHGRSTRLWGPRVMIGFMPLTGSLVLIVFMNTISDLSIQSWLCQCLSPKIAKHLWSKPHWSSWASKPGQQIHILRSVKAISIAHTDEVLSIDGHVQELFQKVAFLKTTPLHLVRTHGLNHPTPIRWPTGFEAWIFVIFFNPYKTIKTGEKGPQIDTAAPNQSLIILLDNAI